MDGPVQREALGAMSPSQNRKRIGKLLFKGGSQTGPPSAKIEKDRRKYSVLFFSTALVNYHSERREFNFARGAMVIAHLSLK